MGKMKRKTKGRIQRFEEKMQNQEEYKNNDVLVQERRKTCKKIRINRGRMAMTVIVIFLIAVLGMSVKNIFVLQSEKRALTAEKEALLLEKESLQDELKNVSDTDYIEEQARIQLKLIKPGEILYILENDKDKEDDKEKNEKKD